MNSQYLEEAFKELDALEEEIFNLREPEAFDKINQFTIDDNELEDVIDVIDPLADSEEDLQDSYANKAIFECSVCYSPIFRDMDEIVIDEDSDTLVNVGDECPYCHSLDGYTIKYKAVPFDPRHPEEENDEEEEVEDEPINDEENFEDKESDLDIDTDKEIDDEEDEKEEVKESLKEGYIGQTLDDFLHDWNTEGEISIWCYDINEDGPIFEGDFADIPQNLLNAQFDDFDTDGKIYVNISDVDEEDELDESCKKNKSKRRLKEEVSDEAYEVADILLDKFSGKNLIEFDEYNDAFYDAIEELDLDSIEDTTMSSEFYKDVRGILSMSGYTTIYEGEHEGGLTTEDIINESKELKEDCHGKDCQCDECKAKNNNLDEALINGRIDSREADVLDRVFTYLRDLKGDKEFCKFAKDYLELSNDELKSFCDLDCQSNLDEALDNHTCKADINVFNIKTTPIDIKLPFTETTFKDVELPDISIDYATVKSLIINELIDRIQNGTPITNHDVDVDFDYEIRNIKCDKELDESIQDVAITTEDERMTMTTKEDGGIVVETEPLDIVDSEALEDLDKEVLAPLSNEDKEEILDNSKSEDDLEDEESEDDNMIDMDVDDFDEESFDRLGEGYLKKVYDNVKSFKTSNIYTDGSKIMVEGVIKFNSNASKKTQFIFEALDTTNRGKVRFNGENAQITSGKKAFKLTGSVADKKFIAESLSYNYRVRNDENKPTRVNGTIK